MGHFAKIVDGKVTQVIVAEPDFFDTFVDSSPGTWLATSYNTYGNKHLKGGKPLRGNFAGVGFTYDATNDVFYAPSPYPSWVFDSNWLWQPPTPMPVTSPGAGKYWSWDETTKTWVAQ